MVSTSVFITVLKMTTDRGSHTLSSSQFVTTPSPLSLSSRRSPYLLCERSHRDRDDTHRTFFLTLGSAKIKGSGDYRSTLAVSRFPFYVRTHLFFVFFYFIFYGGQSYSLQGKVKIRGNEWVNVEQFYSS